MHSGKHTELQLSQGLVPVSRERERKKRRKESVQHLIEVRDDLVQQPQALHSHVVAVQLDVEIIKVWDRGKQDADL